MEIPKYSCGSDDITFCFDKCDMKKCYRHKSNIIHKDIPHSFSNFKNTKMCPIIEDIKIGCEFCKVFDFATAKCEVDKYGAKILLTLTNTKFKEKEQFKYCPVCGRYLK